MSRWVSAGLGATGLAAASVGGYYMFGSGGSEEALLFDDVKDFEEKVNSQHRCVEGFFPGLNLRKGTGNGLTEDSGFHTFLNPLLTSGLPDSNARSCLSIEHQKATGDNGAKWAGKFTWLWTFVSKGVGLMTFNTFETLGEGRAKVGGAFYLLKKKGNEWVTEYHRKQDFSEIEKNGASAYFPVAHERVPSDKYWGFMGEGDLDRALAWKEREVLGKANKVVRNFGWSVVARESAPPFLWTHDTEWWSRMYDGHLDLTVNMSSYLGKWTVLN